MKQLNQRELPAGVDEQMYLDAVKAAEVEMQSPILLFPEGLQRLLGNVSYKTALQFCNSHGITRYPFLKGSSGRGAKKYVKRKAVYRAMGVRPG